MKEEKLLISSEIVFFLCIDLGKDVPEKIVDVLNRENWIKEVKKQELYGLGKYILARKIAPFLLTLTSFIVDYNGNKIEIYPEVRLYLTGACCIRLRVTLNKKTIDETIDIMRMLTLRRDRAIVTSKNISLKDFLNQIIEILTDKIKVKNEETLRTNIANKVKTQYITIILKEPILSKKNLLSTYSKEIAALISWHPDWRDFGEDYIHHLITNPIPTRFKDGFVLTKFPATLLHLPNASKSTLELYLFTIELARISLHFLKVYAIISDKLVKKISEIQGSISLEDSQSLQVLSKELWEFNKLKLEILRATDETKRIRDIIQVHRLLWVFDQLVKESMVDRQFDYINMRINNIDRIINDCYNLIRAEYSALEQTELYYLQAIFVIGVVIQAITLYFIKITNFNWLGFPLTLAAVMCGISLFFMFRKIFLKLRRQSKK